MTTAYDVVVVGGRVAGASTAMLLARAGARVAVIDRGSHGSDTVSTHGLMRAGVLQLSRWGLLAAVTAAGTPPIRRTRFHYADGGSDEVSIRPSAGVPALFAPRRRVLDRIIVDAAAEAGADVWHETAVTALLRDDDGRVIGVRARHRSGGTTEIRGTITVGADGVRSTVADQVDAALLRQGRSKSAVLYRYVDEGQATGYEWAYAPGSAAGLLPTNDGQTCVFVGTTPSRLRALRRHGAEEAFGTLLHATSPLLADRVASASSAGPLLGWGGVEGFVRHSWGSGWALVGDAGYYKDPLTTHGMTDALRDADVLADELIATLSGPVPQAVALARYQATRERLSSRLFDATEAIASYSWDLQEVRTVLRRVSSAMSDEVDFLQARADLFPGSEPRVAWAL